MNEFLRKALTLLTTAMVFLAPAVYAQGTQSTTIARGGEFLTQDKPYVSPNGKYTLIFQSSDGNLVVYKGSVYTWEHALWNAGISGKGGKFAVLQGDGNFVVYKNLSDPSSAVWSSGTQGVPRPNYSVHASLTDKGVFGVYGWGGIYQSPADPLAGSGNCPVAQPYPICVFPGKVAQFNSVVYACSVAEATSIAIATGAVYGQCR